MTLCVLMSVYNGEKYIVEQLDSIFSQEVNDCEIKVVVRDDASSDNTIAICEEYRKNNNVNIQIIRGENLGPSRSFLRLINMEHDDDYYAFSDQDDVWLPGKVQSAVDVLKCNSAVLWISNYNVVDCDLVTLRENALEKPEDNPLKVLFYNNVPGCVMMFNKYLLQEMQKFELLDFRMHDIFALSTALLSGEVFFEKTPFLLYRQHGNNALGFGNKKFILKKWIKEKARYLQSKENYHLPEYAKAVLDVYGEKIPQELYEEFCLLQTYKDSITNVTKLLYKKYTHDGINRTSVSIRLKILMKRF